jgi:glycosyltransferase involved in cell wall biosynthesis
MTVPITVAIATMNRPRHLRRCVKAVLDGDTLPAQIVIVDQGADPSTEAVVNRWRRRVPIRYVRQDRRGLAASRNAAIVHATQSIIAFTDDDCVPDASWLAAIAAAFEGQDRPDAVTGAVLPLGPDRPGLYAVSTRPSRRGVVFRGRALPWAVGTGGNAAVRREWLDRVRFDERFGVGTPGQAAEDLDFFYRLLRTGAVVRYEPKAVIFHERQTVDGRLGRAGTYAFGLGAVWSMWARQGDPYVLWIAARWAIDRADTMVRAFARRQWWRLAEEWLTLQGAWRGAAYGMRVETR